MFSNIKIMNEQFYNIKIMYDPFYPLFRFPDMRKGTCYRRFENGRCTDPKNMPMRQAECCCMMGAAWSFGRDPCSICPREGSGKHSDQRPVSWIFNTKKKQHKRFRDWVLGFDTEKNGGRWVGAVVAQW